MSAAPISIPQAAAALQRRAEARQEPNWVEAARADPATRYLVSRGTTHLVRREPQPQIAFIGPEHEGVIELGAAHLVLLGWFHGRRCMLVDLPPEISLRESGASFEELRSLVALLPEDQAQLLAYARALLVWRSRHRHCGVCGAPTLARSAGHVLACTSTSCGAEFFPRIDPAIIVLVTDARRALLGRQRSWAPGRYSALAGFVEPGESLEDAVAREVEEETGARVTWVRYFASQPWPFPASLMLGFHARASEAPVQLDGELEDAHWFDLEQLRGADDSLLPPPYTIARRLIEAWIQEQTPAA
ncbi:MAG TPA: NAD(+) diphosphatase [Steroidobacteraceae bacterium]|jgi:NAD+ diphosphatase